MYVQDTDSDSSLKTLTRSASSKTHPQDPSRAYWKLSWAATGTPRIRSADMSTDMMTRWSHLSYPFSPRISRAWDYEKNAGKEDVDRDDLTTSSRITSISRMFPPRPMSTVSVESNPPMNITREIAFIFVTCLAQFLSLSAMNQTVAPVLVLADYFHVEDYGTLSWFSASFSMSVGTFILPAGRLGDMYGHKKIYLIGWLWFAAWSLVTGFSYCSNNIFFSICRAFQGIGPALVVPNAVALIGRTLPVGQKRMIGFACFGACGPLGATAGAVMSALLAEMVWWPWSFWVLSGVCIIAMVLAYIILPADDILSSPTQKSERPKFDYWGTITGVSGLVLVNFALNQAPLVTWAEPYIGALLGGGVLCLVIFILVELYATDYPLIPIRGLSIDAGFALTCIVAGWASHGIWAYNLYLFLEHLRGHSALFTSAETAPVAATGVLFAFSTVWLIQRFGIGSVMFLSMTCFMGGSLLIALMPLDQTYWLQTFLSVLIAPGAMNLSYPAANMLLSATLPRKQQGIAASLVSTMVNYSISCGLGVAGTIDRYVVLNEQGKMGPQFQHKIPLSDTRREVSLLRLKGLRAAYWFAVGLGGLGMLVALVLIVVEQRRKRRNR
ncbi:unnamed protein product [Periconia digitata]|uniref:Major facilitator superfamily (MFS) profile domain-containing protein n=1 Tax=Periconia digitata TaxID=1303443 RepID=A0A9W4UQX9_9PLEO|nr:unnamed protein product [Periconia digitata]